MAGELNIRIGGICVGIEGAFEITEASLSSYGAFISSKGPDINLRMHKGIPDDAVGEKVFDCPPIWSLHRRNGTTAIKLFHSPIFTGLQRTLAFGRGMDQWDLYLAEKCADFYDPFYGPTMELLMVNYLAHGRGVIIHSCGMTVNGKGILFVGDSGAGKTTLAQMWAKEEGVLLLSDDRTIVRKGNDNYYIYGTPWHGEGKFGSPEKAQLERVFFITHGKGNTLKDITGIKAVSRLMGCSFPPYWDAQGTGFVLSLLTGLVERVPCYELEFVPDQSVLDFVGGYFS
jgi:hypothetical protein